MIKCGFSLTPGEDNISLKSLTSIYRLSMTLSIKPCIPIVLKKPLYFSVSV